MAMSDPAQNPLAIPPATAVSVSSSSTPVDADGGGGGDVAITAPTSITSPDVISAGGASPDLEQLAAQISDALDSTSTSPTGPAVAVGGTTSSAEPPATQSSEPPAGAAAMPLATTLPDIGAAPAEGMSAAGSQNSPTPIVSGAATVAASSGSTPPSPTPTPSALPNLNTSPSNPTALLQILVDMGDLSSDQRNQIELEQINTGKTIEAIIDEKHYVAEEPLTKAKAQLFNIPFIKLEETGVSPEALTQLPEGVARRYGMLPFSLNKQERSLSVAMRDPLDLLAIDFAEQKSGYRLMPYYAMPSELERLIAERYAQSLSSEVTQALEETDVAAKVKKPTENLAVLSGEVVKQAPITKIVETILAFAVKSRASDIHIEPQPSRTRVRYRIDGLLAEKLILPNSVHEAVVSRIKILSDLKIDEKRVPQDGRFTFFSDGQEVDLRVSTLPTIHGEKIVMRLLRKNASVPSLEELGLSDLALRRVQDAIKVPHGIVLVTGPTGSGKTTTLYSVLHQINTPKVNIMTLEDPVEYQMAGVNQVQINPQAGLTFASGLRSFLRQDPNIIMVGEIRDSETVELAIQASLTGHLVFSTLHTSSAAGAIPRLIDMGAEPFLLASSITLTMAQRIVRVLHEDYKEEYTPEQPIIDDIKQVLGDRYEKWCKQKGKDPQKITLYRTKADRPQTEPEYKGRAAIFEVMLITEEISKLILEQKSASELEKVALKDGMLLMKQDGYLKALDGITTIEEVLRVAQV